MQNVFHNVKVCMTLYGDMHCSNCDCVAGGGSNDAKEANENHMVHTHTFPAIIKMKAVLCKFREDDTCYELATHAYISIF